MKTLLIVVSSVLLGIALGIGLAILQMRWTPWDPRRDEGAAIQTALIEEPKPQVSIEPTEYHFDEIDRHFGRSHDFTLSNVGNAKLALEQGKTSSPCLTVKIDRDIVLPGESAKVTLAWNPSKDPTATRPTAIVHTSDPFRPEIELALTGRLTAMVRAAPEELDFGRFFSGDAPTARVRLWCYRDQTLAITGYRWSNPDMERFAKVDIEPLSAKELDEEPLARSGGRVGVTLHPGFPEGPLKPTLSLITNLESLPLLTLPLAGSSIAEIAVAGTLWDPFQNALRLETFSGKAGTRIQAMLIARGPLRKDVTFRIVRTAPAFLRVSLGEAKEIGESETMQTPLWVEIPPGTPSADHLGPNPEKMGEIVIETSNPRVPSLRVFVSFAVAE